MIAIVIGHDEFKPGAINKRFGVSEFDINNELANIIKELSINNIEVVYRDNYKDLPNKINKLNPDYIISLHCNAYNKCASGSEVLYYYKSTKSKNLAYDLQLIIKNTLGLPDRGIKGISRYERGGHLLKNTNAPCVILEPFFIDNDNDYKTFIKKYKEYITELIKYIDKL